MWAPADLFGPGTSVFTRLMRRVVTYFYENLMVLAIVLLAIAVLIAVLTRFGSGRARRT